MSSKQTKTIIHWSDKLPKDACDDASDWCRGQSSLSAAWSSCQRGDWMLWIAGCLSGKPDSPARRKLVGCAAECARLSLPFFEAEYPGDSRVRDCLDLCDRYAAGDKFVTRDQLLSAERRACAGHASGINAYAAAYAAFAATDASYAAFVAARTGAPAACSNIVRKWYPTPPELES